MALCWTHLFLPMFGEADLFQRSAAELMSLHISLERTVYIWGYTAVITSACWWLYVVAEKKVSAFAPGSELGLSHHVSTATWGTLATSLVYVTVWAWIVALLSVLPTGNPLLAFLSGAVITVVAATSVVVGQRGCGPFLLLRSSKPDRVKTVVFFTTIMTAMMWVGALDYAITFYAPTSYPHWVISWGVALALCIVRWIMLWQSAGARRGLLTAIRYPSTPDLALSVGLVVQRRDAADANTNPLSLGRTAAGGGSATSPLASPLLSLPSVLPAMTTSMNEVHQASLGLSALVVAWSGSVALQAASTTTWKAWPYEYASVEAVAPATAYALGMIAIGVYAVATARAIAETDGRAKERAIALASETAALGVASGWAVFHALECIFPALVAPSPFARAIGTVLVTAFGVMLMLALKPPANSAYSNPSSLHGGETFGSAPMGGDAASPSLQRDCSPTSTHYRAFVDLRRTHSAEWLPPTMERPHREDLRVDVREEALPVYTSPPLTTSTGTGVGTGLGADVVGGAAHGTAYTSVVTSGAFVDPDPARAMVRPIRPPPPSPTR